jgi:hypothetical protein
MTDSLNSMIDRHENEDHQESYLPEETLSFLESQIWKGYRACHVDEHFPTRA